MEENQLSVQSIEPKVFSPVEIKQQVQAIQQIMHDEGIMQRGTHYGTVPGCGDKPTLLKAGAEKIMMTFRLAADFEIHDLSTHDAVRYRIKTRIFSILTGNVVGYGIGECSTDESKFRWRGVASDAEYEACDPTRRRIKFYKSGHSKQVRTEVADQANTVLKMAKKRSLVDGILTATAASDIFTQDLEDIVSNDTADKPKTGNGKPEVAAPVALPEQPKHVLTDKAKSQMTELMDEMGYDEKKKILAFQRAELVGELAALEGLGKQYDAFLKEKSKNV